MGELIDLRERQSLSDTEWRLRLANKLRELADDLADENRAMPIGMGVAVLCEGGYIHTWCLADSGAGLLHLLGLLSKQQHEVEVAVDDFFESDDAP